MIKPRDARWSSLYTGLSAAALLLLVLSLFGLLPLREPEPPKPVAFAPAKAVEPVRLPAPSASAPLVSQLVLWSFPLCTKPSHGAKLYRVALGAERDAFVVWCQSEFLLLDVAAGSAVDGAPRITRLGRFAARGELPGGALALDLDGDATLDLALGVAPAPSAIHRPFSGVFWLRGRPAGGYELPRTLVEMPVVGLEAAELDGAPGSELMVLTRGDPVAQRPGELWLFAGGTSPTRAAVLQTALAPSDLVWGPARDAGPELWLSSTQPGSLVRFRFTREATPAVGAAPGTGWTKPERTELALRGVQSFVAGPRDDRALLVRGVNTIQRLDSEATPKLTPWLEQAELGPSAWLHSARDGKPVVFGATQTGFSWLRGDKRNERSLPKGTRVLDVSSNGAGAAHARAVLLIETEEQGPNLALVVLPVDVRDEASDVELRSGAVEASPTEAHLTLE
ncbi:MAG: hypothetical protein RLZZ450_2712 [Pseudomonadota bacterium]